jgi:hypothetical protein
MAITPCYCVCTLLIQTVPPSCNHASLLRWCEIIALVPCYCTCTSLKQTTLHLQSAHVVYIILYYIIYFIILHYIILYYNWMYASFSLSGWSITSSLSAASPYANTFTLFHCRSHPLYSISWKFLFFLKLHDIRAVQDYRIFLFFYRLCYQWNNIDIVVVCACAHVCAWRVRVVYVYIGVCARVCARACVVCVLCVCVCACVRVRVRSTMIMMTSEKDAAARRLLESQNTCATICYIMLYYTILHILCHIMSYHVILEDIMSY